MLHRLIFAALIGYASTSYSNTLPADLKITAERENWLKTGRYDEVEKLCVSLPRHFPKNVRCDSFGTTPEGRPMLAFIATSSGKFTPDAKTKKPAVLFQGGIHAGEIDGKDAGTIFLREVLEGKRLPGVLDKLTLVFVPVYNVDGFERFGTNHRPNQIGPLETGWRTTAQNYNLNRDYLKVDAPETEAMLQLLNAWDPLVYIDLHVTNGAKFQHDIAVMVEPAEAGPEALRKAGLDLREVLMKDLAAAGNLPLWFYPSFDKDDDPTSGISIKPHSARFSNGYWALRNRLGVLVETHAWRNYQHRCQATLATLNSIVAEAAKKAGAWREAAKAADQETARLAAENKDTVLSYTNGPRTETFAFLGYTYTRNLSPVSGQAMTVYNPDQKTVWNLPLRRDLLPKLTLKAPTAGYLIPPAYRKLFENRLKLHEIQYKVLGSAQTLKAERYRMSEVKLKDSSYEKHQRAEYKGAWSAADETISAGSLWIPSAQAASRLLLTIFEPDSDDSFLAWGFFNEIFERKEYMEPYVAEELAQEMLKDPKIRQEFEAKLASDAEFAKSPQQRLDFFYKRHPSFDERLNSYPILRISTAPRLL